jgi:sortase A
MKSSAGPLIRGESSVRPCREQKWRVSAPEVSKDKANLGSSGVEPEPEFSASPVAEPLPQPEAKPKPGQRTRTVGESGWSRPTSQEVEAANGPRYYDMPSGAIMGLTIDSIGIYGAPVFDSAGKRALANGVVHLPDTSLPWSPTQQRNVYLAGHRMGFRGTWSRMIFYNLDKLGEGDKIVLKDRTGHTYEYQVSETLLVEPTDQWVTGQMRGRDMLTLQTCTPIPTFEKRLIVRADRL